MKSSCSLSWKPSRTALLLCLLMTLLIPTVVSAQTLDPQDWESGWGDWWVDNGLWQVGPATFGPPDSAYNGHSCAGTVLGGNYTEPKETNLISPIFTVPAASENPRLRFYHWFSYSSGDYGQVLIHLVDEGVDSLISPSYSSHGSVWTRTSLDLTPFSGREIQIKFHHYSVQVGFYSNVSSGWYIDDVEIVTGAIVFNSPEGFESGLGDWSADRGVWQVGTPSSGPGGSYSGDSCAGTVLSGNYTESQSSNLVSPIFTVPAASENPRLRFYHWFSYSSGDYGQVLIHLVDEGVDSLISPNDFIGSSSVWSPTNIPLTMYANKRVQIKFHHYSVQVGFYSNVSSGWYVDDIRIETSCPLIHCSPASLNSSVCQLGDDACVRFPIENWSNVSVDGATWANDTLCFTADNEGEYKFTVIASNAQCADTCEVTVNVTVETPLILDTDNLAFFTYDTATVLPGPQTIHISSSCPEGTLDWSLSVPPDATWLDVGTTSGSNPDSVQFSIVSKLSPGIYTALLKFTQDGQDADTAYVNLSVLVESGIDVGDFVTRKDRSFSVPINFYTTDSLESFSLPLKLGTSQPLDVRIDSVKASDPSFRDSVLFNDDSTVFAFHPFQPPPPPDSVYELGRVYITVGPGAFEETFLIDTVTAEIGGETVSYQFTEVGGVPTVPYFNPGIIEIDLLVPTSVDGSQDNASLPNSYTLAQNYPNPFNPTTRIEFSLPVAVEVRLEIYNIMGQRVVTLVDGFMKAGPHSVDWQSCDASGRKVASGIYLYRLTMDQFTAAKKMVLLK